MLYREYGSTGVTVSALGFGGMRFPEPANIDKMAEIPLAAFRRGVTYFDTAPFYCNDKSETILGVAIQEMKKSGKPFYVSTKTFGADESSIRKDLERSLDRLGVEAIDFYHIWCIKTPENFAERKRRGALEAMLECKAEGLVRHIAVSSHMSGEDTAAMLDEGVFEGVLLGYCAANFPFRETALDAARRKGLAVVTMNPLGGGLIPKHPDRFDFIRTRPDEPIVEAALRFNLSQPAVTVVLQGASSVEHVHEAADAVDRFEPIPRERQEQMRSAIQDSFNELCTSCGYCADCPEGIPVLKLMEAFNFLKLEGPKMMRDRLKIHWSIDPLELIEACSECRQCEDSCTQHLPILERFEEIERAMISMR